MVDDYHSGSPTIEKRKGMRRKVGKGKGKIRRGKGKVKGKKGKGKVHLLHASRLYICLSSLVLSLLTKFREIKSPPDSSSYPESLISVLPRSNQARLGMKLNGMHEDGWVAALGGKSNFTSFLSTYVRLILIDVCRVPKIRNPQLLTRRYYPMRLQ
jgi:hypothetical protein